MVEPTLNVVSLAELGGMMANQRVADAGQRVLEFLETEIQGFVVGDLTRLGN